MGTIRFKGTSKSEKAKQTFTAGGHSFPRGEAVELPEIPKEIAALPRKTLMNLFEFEGFPAGVLDKKLKPGKKEVKPHDKRSESEDLC